LKWIRLIAVLGLGASIANTASAQSSPAQALLDDRLVIHVGAFALNTNIRANLNGRSSSNPDIDFDEVFGRSNDTTRVRADVLWRVTPGHNLRFLYFNNSVDRTKIVDQSLAWGDATYGIGARVDFRHELEIFELAYEYAFVRQPAYELAASLGVHLTDLTLQLSGNASLTRPDGSIETASATTRSSSLPAPLPVIGLRGGWVIAPNWYVDGLVQYFRASLGGYDGYWSDIRVGATWMYNRHVGIGLGYNRFATSLKIERDDFNGRLRTGYSGLQAYLSFAF
jgi:hypothetical protein